MMANIEVENKRVKIEREREKLNNELYPDDRTYQEVIRKAQDKQIEEMKQVRFQLEKQGLEENARDLDAKIKDLTLENKAYSIRN